MDELCLSIKPGATKKIHIIDGNWEKTFHKYFIYIFNCIVFNRLLSYSVTRCNLL